MELPNTLPSIRLMITGSPDPLPQPVNDPTHGWSFPYAVSGQYTPQYPTPNTQHPTPPKWLPRFRIYAQRREHLSLARRSCRFLLRCFEFALVRLGRDHSFGYEGILNLYLCTEGKPGAEQNRDRLYLYRVDPDMSALEWARELAHEYGHAVVPPINSFKEPEAWANGDLGERLFLNWCLQDLRAKRLTPEDLMEAREADLERYRARSIEPLITRMEREGLNPARWRSRRRDGYEEYLALALYAEQLFGAERLKRAMLIAGGTEPDDFLSGLRESLLESETLEVNLRKPQTWLFLPGGLKQWKLLKPTSGVQLSPDSKRLDWVRVQIKTPTLPVRLRFRSM